MAVSIAPLTLDAGSQDIFKTMIKSKDSDIMSQLCGWSPQVSNPPRPTSLRISQSATSSQEPHVCLESDPGRDPTEIVGTWHSRTVFSRRCSHVCKVDLSEMWLGDGPNSYMLGKGPKIIVYIHSTATSSTFDMYRKLWHRRSPLAI